jgi:hypothetical protein
MLRSFGVTYVDRARPVYAVARLDPKITRAQHFTLPMRLDDGSNENVLVGFVSRAAAANLATEMGTGFPLGGVKCCAQRLTFHEMDRLSEQLQLRYVVVANMWCDTETQETHHVLHLAHPPSPSRTDKKRRLIPPHRFD